MIIRRIAPLSAAKVMAIVYAVIGLFIGAVISLVGFAGGFGTQDLPFAGFGIGAIIILPIIYGCIGFVAMLLIASLYNWAAGITGGIEIETDSIGVGP
jgi:hypothetical protein